MPGKSTPLVERFARLVHHEPNTGCWLWSGATTKGYGVIANEHGKSPRQCYAHRASWQIHRGDIPIGLLVLHNCPCGDQPLCVNPDHLWLGTQLENIEDMANQWRGIKSSLGLPFGALRQRSGRFGAMVTVSGKRTHVGTFDTAEEASAAAIAMRSQLRAVRPS